MDADSITISIRTVDESGPALQQVETRILGVGTAASSTTQLMRGLGGAAAGSTAEFNALRSAIEANTAALNSFHGNLPKANQELGHMHGNMRLVSGTAREFGLNLGYSMRSFLAESPAAIGAIHAMEIGFLAMAAVDIGVQVIEGVQHLYEKWFDVTKAVDDYEKKAAEAARVQLFDTASIETTISLLGQVGAQVDELTKKKEEAGVDKPLGGLAQWLRAPAENPEQPGIGLEGTQPPIFTAKDDQALAQANENQARGKEHQHAQEHERNMQSIKDQEQLATVGAGTWGKIAAAQHAANAEAAETARYAKQHEQDIVAIAQKYHDLQVARGDSADKIQPVPKVNPNAGDAEYQAAIARAATEARAKQVEEGRRETQEEIGMRNEAIQAGMTGEALYDHQRTAAEDAITRKILDGTLARSVGLKEIDDIDMKSHNAKMQRLEDEEQATRKIQQQAEMAGAATLPKLQMQTQFGIENMTTEATKAGLPDDQVQARRKAMEQTGNQDILKAREEFTQKINELTERSNDQMTAGLAQVAARERAALDALAREYEDWYGKDQGAWQGYQDRKTAIEQGAERERQKLSEDVDRSIAQTEAEAARALLPPWQAAQQKIADEYQQRLAKIREDVEQHVITEEQGAREVKAAWDQTNSEMERAAMESRDRMAGQLASFFDNPAKYMQQRAKQVMFDIMANWMQQAEQANPRLQGIFGGIFGQNQVGTGSPQHALGQLFGAHGATHDQSGLTNASSTLISAGSTLSASGTMLASSAAALAQAATMWESALYQRSAGTGGGGTSAWTSGGATAGTPSPAGGWTPESDNANDVAAGPWTAGEEAAGAGSGAGGSLAGAGGPSGAGGVGALSQTLISPQLLSMIPGGSAISQTLGLYQGFTKLFSSSGGGSGAQLLNASGGFQPSDISQAPTDSAGVMGTVPDGSGAASDDNSSAGGSSALGEIGGIATGGMTAYSGLSAAWNSSNIGTGLIGAGTAALGGAEIGTMFMPGIGTAIGAAIGFGAGLAADLLGDHGASKARHYNTLTVVPTLQQLMNGYGTGGDYDSASMGINNLQIQSQKQTAQWGSGATSFYHSVMVPEFSNAQQQVDREGRAGRANVTTTAAQFHGGGWIDDFLDMATSDSEGFIHARQGEYMMHNAAASTNAPWLEAMNRGLDMTAALAPVLSPGATPRETGAASSYVSAGRGGSMAGGPASSGSAVHLHVHAWDSKDVNRWMRGGGAMQIQTELNRNAARYSGKALSS